MAREHASARAGGVAHASCVCVRNQEGAPAGRVDSFAADGDRRALGSGRTGPRFGPDLSVNCRQRRRSDAGLSGTEGARQGFPPSRRRCAALTRAMRSRQLGNYRSVGGCCVHGPPELQRVVNASPVRVLRVVEAGMAGEWSRPGQEIRIQVADFFRRRQPYSPAQVHRG